MHKEINNINIFGKIIARQKNMKNFIIYITGNSSGYLNDQFGSLYCRKLFRTHSNTNVKEQFNFQKTTTENQNISKDSADDNEQ